MISDDSINSRPRGARPDAETGDRIFLIKNVSSLRATYQVRLLALKASTSGKRLVLQVPAACRFEPGLQALIAGQPGLIRRENLG